MSLAVCRNREELYKFIESVDYKEKKITNTQMCIITSNTMGMMLCILFFITKGAILSLRFI